MCPIDARIPLMAQAPAMPDVIKQHSNLQALQSAMNSNQIQGQVIAQNQMTLEAMNQQMRDRKRAREIIAGANGDYEAARPQLIAELGPDGVKIADELQASEQKRKEYKQTDAENAQTNLTYLQSEVNRLRRIPEGPQRQAEYRRIIQALPEEMRANLPPTVDDEFLIAAGDNLQYELDRIARQIAEFGIPQNDSGLTKGEATLEAGRTERTRMQEAGATERANIMYKGEGRYKTTVEDKMLDDFLAKNPGLGAWDYYQAKQQLIQENKMKLIQERDKLIRAASQYLNAYEIAEIVNKATQSVERMAPDYDDETKAAYVNGLLQNYFNNTIANFGVESQDVPFWPFDKDVPTVTQGAEISPGTVSTPAQPPTGAPPVNQSAPATLLNDMRNAVTGGGAKQEYMDPKTNRVVKWDGQNWVYKDNGEIYQQ